MDVILLAICFYLYLSVWMAFNPLQIWHMTYSNIQFFHFPVKSIFPILAAFKNVYFIHFHIFPLVKYCIRKWFPEFVSPMQCNLIQHYIFLSLSLVLTLFPSYLIYHSYFFDSSLKENHFSCIYYHFFNHCQFNQCPRFWDKNLSFVNKNKNPINYFVEFFWEKIV